MKPMAPAPCTYKGKYRGELIALPSELQFHHGNAALVSLPWATITGQQLGSKPGGVELLKLLTAGGRSYKFAFEGGGVRTHWCDGMDARLKRRRPAEPEAAAAAVGGAALSPAERSALLDDDAELRGRYERFVSHGPLRPACHGELSDRDFWDDPLVARHLAERGATAPKRARAGGSGGGGGGGEATRARLSPEQIEQILRTEPAVRQAYANAVPDVLPEASFWQEYLFAKHFHRARGKGDDAGQLAVSGAVERDTVATLRNGRGPDLAADEGGPAGHGCGENSRSLSAVNTAIQRMVNMRSSEGVDDWASQSHTPERAELGPRAAPQQRGSSFSQPPEVVRSARASGPAPARDELVALCSDNMRNWKPSLDKELASGRKASLQVDTPRSSARAPAASNTCARETFELARELLRHLFMAQQEGRPEKVQRLRASLDSLDLSSAGELLQQMIAAAYLKV